jgi:hypothetical protein
VIMLRKFVLSNEPLEGESEEGFIEGWKEEI